MVGKSKGRRDILRSVDRELGGKQALSQAHRVRQTRSRHGFLNASSSGASDPQIQTLHILIQQFPTAQISDITIGSPQ